MKKYLTALLLLAACTPALQDNIINPTPEDQKIQDRESALVSGVMIVEVSEELAEQLDMGTPRTKSSAFNSVIDRLAVKDVKRLFPDAGEWEQRHREAGLHRWFRISYDPEACPVTKAAMDFTSVDGVLYAEPERRIKSTAYFNDPYAQRQWALFNDGSLGDNYKAGCDINVEDVWTNYTGGSSNVIVAILDQGVQLDHPDLAAIAIPAGENGSRNFIYENDPYTIHPEDHGTHCAGVIGAVSNNEIGISGIAGGLDGNGGVRIMSCNVSTQNPSNPDESIWGNTSDAMVWAADHGAVIASNSWGYVYENEEAAKKGGVGSMKKAIDYFIQYAGCDKSGKQRPDSPMKGGVVIFASGNDAWSMGWPGAYEPVIAVAGTSAQYTRAYYSNYGDWVDICAPGGDAKQNTYIVSTIAEGKYGNMQGTSMACPQVAGVAALIASYFGGPGFTNDMLKERLLGGANQKAVSKDLLIGPLVDALGAFTYNGTEAPLPAADVSNGVFSNRIIYSFKVTADPDDIKTYGYLAVAAKDASLLQNLNPEKLPEGVKSISVKTGKIPVGETISIKLEDLEFETDYSAAVFAYDYSGHYSAMSEIQKVRTGENHAPTVTTEYTGKYVLMPYEKIDIEYAVSDPDEHAFKVEIDPGSAAFTFTKPSATIQCSISGNGAPHGKYTAHIVATDAYGATTDYPVDYEILENFAPQVAAKIENQQFKSVGEVRTFKMDDYFHDANEEPLTYTATSSDPSVAQLSRSGDSMVLTALGYGLTTITVTATDACNAHCQLSFMVLVRDNSRPVDLYPVPVTSTLNIRPGQEGQLEVSVYNKAGATVLSCSEAASPFAPLALDMSAQPGGVYYVRINGAGIDDIYTIAKL